jgi:hypothetical protein
MDRLFDFIDKHAAGIAIAWLIIIVLGGLCVAYVGAHFILKWW